MGMFDNFIKMADQGLKAVENGALEKAIVNGLDKLESGLDSAIEKADAAAARPEELLKKAHEKHQQVTDVAKNAGQTVTKTIDGIQKRLQ